MGYRSTTVTSLLGPARYERPYYHCSSCGHGHFPTDEDMSIESRKTRGTQEILALAGVTDAFEEAAEKVVAKMSGLRVSKSTVHRTTEAAGEKLAQKRAQGETISPKKPWDWQKDAQGRRVA